MFTHTGRGRLSWRRSSRSDYLLERLVDVAARELGIARDELRRRNMVPSGTMPYATPVGKTYDSGDFVRNLDDGSPGDTTPASPRGARRRAPRASRHRPRRLYRAMGDPTDEFAEMRFVRLER